MADETAGVCNTGVQQEPRALQSSGRKHNDSRLQRHLAMRQTVNKPAAVGLAGILVDRNLAYDRILNGGELARGLSVRQQEIYRAGQAIAACCASLLADGNSHRLCSGHEPLPRLTPRLIIQDEVAI